VGIVWKGLIQGRSFGAWKIWGVVVLVGMRRAGSQVSIGFWWVWVRFAVYPL
jgi:hypothetical protein